MSTVSSPPRALLSVYDKTGIVEFATALDALGYELLSTGGTARTLREAGLPVTLVSDVTQHPEIFDGRVKSPIQPFTGRFLQGSIWKRMPKKWLDSVTHQSVWWPATSIRLVMPLQRSPA